MNAAFFTLGCKVNQYDTDALIGLFRAAGHSIVGDAKSADACIVNSCCVTATSEQKTRQLVSKLHRQNPAALIAVCGCYAQRAADEIKQLPGVRIVAGSKDRAALVSLVEDALLRDISFSIEPGRPDTGYEELAALPESRTRAQLKIQDGCDKFCTYCIIPYVRGRACSRSLDDIALQARQLADIGVKEIVLTGINLSSYGCDNGHTLPEAIGAVAQSGVPRIRLGSLDPEFITEEFVAFLQSQPAICPHFHLSMQSGSEGVLARMRRRHTPAAFERGVMLLRAALPGCAITADVIAGFPGETEEEHGETLAFVRRMAFSRIHVFPYSIREGTKAAAMDNQLPKAIKTRRAGELIALGQELTRAYLTAQLGSVQQVLFEEGSAPRGYASGYTGAYVEVRVESAAEPGSICPVRLERVEGEHIYGTISSST